MTLENDIKDELKKADELLTALAQVRPLPPQKPHYGHLGDLKWFNEKLTEIIETFGTKEVR